MKHRICIHGHFYQPLREDPWTGRIGYQQGAAPYPNWNEKILDECYKPNTAARVLDPEGWTIDAVNNFSWISFDAGPTLLSWLEGHDPSTYGAIIAGDREAQARFGGHGTAIAQAYHHIILPLATRRQKEMEVRSGIEDFRARFGRPPEGMWLPEMAVDLQTLEVLAAEGILFTVLEPRQAEAVHLPGEEVWHDLPGGILDTSVPYRCTLPSGGEITIFFSDTPVSHGIAFGDLLGDGGRFADALLSRLPVEEGRPALESVATDGETYGHHKRFGEMALAYAIRTIEQGERARMTVFGEFLEENPPVADIRIRERTSWSCDHVLARWNRDCPCSATPRPPGWSHRWRGVLREAMDMIRTPLFDFIEMEARGLFEDPCSALDDLSAFSRDLSDQCVAKHLSRYGVPAEGASRAVLLLDAIRNLQRMYTSCGWFFDDITGIEAVQVMRYAARALQACREMGGPDLERRFREALSSAPVNAPGFRDGSAVYDTLVSPWISQPIDLLVYSILLSPQSAGQFQAHVGTSRVEGHILAVDTDETSFTTKGVITFSYPLTSPGVSREFTLYEGGRGETRITLTPARAGGCNPLSVDTGGEIMDLPPSLVGTEMSTDGIPLITGRIIITSDHFTPGCRALALERRMAHCLSQICQMTAFLDMGRDNGNTGEVAVVHPLIREMMAYTAARGLESDILSGRLDMPGTARETAALRESPSPLYARDIARAADERITGLLVSASGTDLDPGPLCRAMEIARTLEAASIAVPLRGAERTLFTLAKRCLPAKADQAAKGDPHAREWCSCLSDLAKSLHVRLPTVEIVGLRERVG